MDLEPAITLAFWIVLGILTTLSVLAFIGGLALGWAL